jgi:hypothetical protein
MYKTHSHIAYTSIQYIPFIIVCGDSAIVKVQTRSIVKYSEVHTVITIVR